MASTKKIVVSLVVAGASVGLLTNPSFALSIVRPPRPSFSSAAKIAGDKDKLGTNASGSVEVTATADLSIEPAPTTSPAAPEPKPEPTTVAAPPKPEPDPTTTAAAVEGTGTTHVEGTGDASGAPAEPTTTVKKDDRTPSTLVLTCHLQATPTRPAVACTWSGETPVGATKLMVLRNDGRVRLSTGDTSVRTFTDTDAGAGKHFSYVVVFLAAESTPTLAHSNPFAIDTPAAPNPPASEAPKPAPTAPHSEPTTTATAPHNEPTTTAAAPHNEPTTTAAASSETSVAASIHA
jgi:hypothetical protein